MEQTCQQIRSTENAYEDADAYAKNKLFHVLSEGGKSIGSFLFLGS
jgi:hypothetical protein